MTNNNMVQINVLIPKDWKEHLEKLAREASYQEDKDLNFHDIIRRVLQKEFGFNSCEKVRRYRLESK